MYCNCGIIGIYNENKFQNNLYNFSQLLEKLQHRGRESAGICHLQQSKLNINKGMGLVSDIFDKDTYISQEAAVMIGHVRYSTSGSEKTSSIEKKLLGEIRSVSMVQRWQRPYEYFSGWRNIPKVGGRTDPLY